MPLTDADFELARHYVPSLKAERRNNAIYQVTADMRGIVGHGSKTPMVYKVRVTLDGYPASAPLCYITEPADSVIRHMNIYRGSSGNLPRVCVGRFENHWHELSASERSIMNFFIDLSQVLLNENPQSVARA